MVLDLLSKKRFWITMDSICLVFIVILLLVSFIFPRKQEYKEIEVKEEIKEEENISPIKVDLKGEVNSAKVYELKENNTLGNLLKLAKGLKNAEDIKNYNLAYMLTDGEAIEIKKINVTTTKETKTNINRNNNLSSNSNSKTEVKKDNTPTSNSNVKTDESNKEEVIEEPVIVNINTAGIDLLVKLNGIGEKKAQAIIDYRIQNGKFKSIEEITKVNGIGNATFEKIKSYLRV